MGEQTIRVLDFKTGQITETQRVVADATVEERFQRLMAATVEVAGELIAGMMAVRCDGCNAIAEVDRPQLPDGWTSDQRGDLCPSCQ